MLATPVFAHEIVALGTVHGHGADSVGLLLVAAVAALGLWLGRGKEK